ncbi:MAG: S-layer homology domain-containing protein [Clostridiales bacterium]|nr:S-layer homology domain-containing protein [Clostridiales bacterium]
MKDKMYMQDFEVLYSYVDPDTGECEGGSYDCQIIVPAIENWPSVTFSGITPENVFYKEPGLFRVLGSGFDNLDSGSIEQTGDVEIVLQNVKQSENRIQIPSYAINIVSDNLLSFFVPTFTNPNKKLGMDEEYTVSIKTREDSLVGVNTFSAKIMSSNLEKYKNKDYGILCVYRNKEKKVHHLKVFDGERKMDQFFGSDGELQLLIEVRGSIFGNEENGFEIGDESVINGAVKYNAPEGQPDKKMFINKYSADSGHAEPYISLDGEGVLTAQGTNVISDSFSLELEDGKNYTYSFPPPDPWGEGTEWGDQFSGGEPLPIEIQRENPVVEFTRKIGGWLVSIEDIKLRPNGVSLGGKMKFFGAGLGGGVGVEDIRYSSSGYEGIKANAEAGVPSGLIPGIKLGGTGTVKIDTMEDLYGIEVDFQFKILNGKGTMIMKVPVENNTVYTPYPDTIDFEVSGSRGFPVIPGATLFRIVRGGGGIHNISTVVEGEQHGSPSPWVRFTGGIADPTGKLLKGDPVTIYVTKNKARIEGTVSIISLSLADAILSVSDSAENGVRVSGEGGLNILDLLDGRAKVYIGYNESNLSNPFRPLDLGGKGKVSGNLLGFKLAGGMAGISNENVYIRGKVLGKEIGAKYYWQEEKIVLASVGAANLYPERDGEYIYKETKDGKKIVIDNFKVISSSKMDKKFKYLASLDGGVCRLPFLSSASSTRHDIEISEAGDYFIKIPYEGSFPDLTLTKPGGKEFALQEDQNYSLSEENGQKVAFVLLEGPEMGTWQLESSVPVGYELIKIAELPGITGAKVISTSIDLEKDSNAELRITTNKGKDLKVRLYLSKNTEDAGQLAGEYDLTDNECMIDMDIPEEVSAGEYYVRAELMREGSNIDSLYSDNTMLLSGGNTPEAPGSVELANAGGNHLKATWIATDEKADGYYIEILDANGDPLPEAGTAYCERSDSMTQETLIAARWNIEGQEAGLVDGKSYNVAVSAYNTVTGEDAGEEVEVTYTSGQVNSNSVVFREADPPELDFTLENNAGKLNKATYQGQKAYFTSEREISILLKAGENSELEIKYDDSLVADTEGMSLRTSLTLQEGANVLLVTARDGAGDTTKKRILVVADSVPPVLMVESPEQGQVVEGERLNVTGFTESGNRVTINGREIQPRMDGTFAAALSVKGSQSKKVLIEAEDKAGNKSAYETKVMKSSGAQIKSIMVSVAANRIDQGKSVHLHVYGTKDDGSELLVDSSRVNWSLISGDEYAEITENGELTINDVGPVLVMASYPLTGGFALEDIRELSIGEVELEAGTFNVTYRGNGNTGGSVPVDSENYQRGDSVTFLGNTGSLVKTGYTFSGWNTVIDGSGTSYYAGDTFSMGGANVILYAQWVPRDNSGSDHNDGDNQSDTDPGPEVYPMENIVETEEGQVPVVSAELPFTMDTETGVTSVKVGPGVMEDLVEKAKGAEKEGASLVIEMKVDTDPSANAVQVDLAGEAFSKLPEAGGSSLKIDTGMASTIFDGQTLKSIGTVAAGEDINITTAKVDNNTLPAAAREKVGSRPVYDFNVRAGDTAISDFNGGHAEVCIPYVPEPGEKKNSIVVYYIDDRGNLNTVRGRYSEQTGTVDFTTSHFSKFAVGYNEVNFSDVLDSDWYSEPIGFMAAREIVNGVGQNKFAPDDNVTRAEFLVMVMNAYGIERDRIVTDNFSDARKAYYTPYLGTAKRLGLVSGVGNNLYMPDARISRQDMFVILHRILEQLGELPGGDSGRTLGSFNDAGEISGYAVNTLKLFVETGTIEGDGQNLNPKANSTRAEATQVLYNLLSR